MRTASEQIVMPPRKFTSGFQVTAEPLPPVEQLEPIWLELQSRSTPSFFVSWPWIECWIKWLPKGTNAELIQIREAQRLIALAILVRTRQRRHKGLIRSRSLHLHSTGIESLDELSIEFNAQAGRYCSAPVCVSSGRSAIGTAINQRLPGADREQYPLSDSLQHPSIRKARAFADHLGPNCR